MGYILVRCRFWNIADEDFIKDSAFNNLKLRASWKYRKSKYPSSCSWKPTFAGPDLYATFFNTANGYGNTAAILRGQIGILL
jgi:hypothetical protein